MWLGRVMAGQDIWLLFVAKVAMGVGTYALGVFLLWRLASCPKGGETYLLEKLMRRRGTVANNG